MALTKTIFLKIANSVRLAMGETKDEIAQRTGTPENPVIQIDGEARFLTKPKEMAGQEKTTTKKTQQLSPRKKRIRLSKRKKKFT